MAEIVEFNPVDDNNTLFPEGMPPGDVNNDARAMLGALARMWELTSGALTTTGDANGYVVTPTGTGWGNLVQGLKFTVKAHVTSAADCTLAFAGNAAVVIRDVVDFNLPAGALKQGSIYTFAYTGSDWQLVGIGGTVAADWATEGNTDLIPLPKTRVPVADLTFGGVVDWPAGTFPNARIIGAGDAVLAAPSGVLDGDFYILTYVQGTWLAGTAWGSMCRTPSTRRGFVPTLQLLRAQLRSSRSATAASQCPQCSASARRRGHRDGRRATPSGSNSWWGIVQSCT